MSDRTTDEPVAVVSPVVVASKNNATTIHAVLALASFTLASVVCRYFNLPDSVSNLVSTFVGLILISMGLIQSADAATQQATAAELSHQFDKGIALAKADMLALHNKNSEKIAVHAVQIAGVAPPPRIEETIKIRE